MFTAAQCGLTLLSEQATEAALRCNEHLPPERTPTRVRFGENRLHVFRARSPMSDLNDLNDSGAAEEAQEAEEAESAPPDMASQLAEDMYEGWLDASLRVAECNCVCNTMIYRYGAPTPLARSLNNNHNEPKGVSNHFRARGLARSTAL